VRSSLKEEKKIPVRRQAAAAGDVYVNDAFGAAHAGRMLTAVTE